MGATITRHTITRDMVKFTGLQPDIVVGCTFFCDSEVAEQGTNTEGVANRTTDSEGSVFFTSPPEDQLIGDLPLPVNITVTCHEATTPPSKGLNLPPLETPDGPARVSVRVTE